MELDCEMSDSQPTGSPKSVPRPASTVSLPKDPVKRVSLNFGELEFYPHHMVSRMNAGVHLDEGEFNEILGLIEKHFGIQPYGYLSDRVADYSVNPVSAQRVVSDTTVVAGAFVIRNQRAREVSKVERLFYNAPVLLCATMEEAELFLATHLFPEGE